MNGKCHPCIRTLTTFMSLSMHSVARKYKLKSFEVPEQDRRILSFNGSTIFEVSI